MTLVARAEVPAGIDEDLVAVVRDFVRREVTPSATRFEAEGVHPWTFSPQLAAMGLYAAGIDSAHGGVPVNEATRVRIAEELAYSWSALAVTTTQQWVAAGLIGGFGTTGQKDRWLGPIARGEAVASISLSEPGGGSDTSALRCRAVPDGDDYLVTGTKTWVTNGSRADVIVLAARIDDRISAFVIEPGGPGFGETMTVSAPFAKLGHRASDTVEIGYAGHRVPSSSLLGGADMRGRGQHAFLDRLDVGRLHIGACALGIARAALDRALAYAAERTAFGKPIDQHQAVAFKLAAMATQVKVAQLMLDDAAARYDAGEDIGLACSMAKLVCSEAGLNVSREALRIHGGIGYMSELPVERFFRDAPLFVIGEGTNEIQHIVISRWLKKLGGLPRA